MRVKTGYTRRQRHRKVLHETRGYYGDKSRRWRRAHEAWMRSGAFAYAHRKDKKGDFRRLWIVRINAALRPFGLNYSRFMHGLSEAGIRLNRKVLADMAAREPDAIGELVELARKAMG